MKIHLDESEVKLALRVYIENNIECFDDVNPWGMMSMEVNGNRIQSVTLNFEDIPEDYDNDK